MRQVAIVACCLVSILVSSVRHANASVQVVVPQKSHQKVRITVLLDAKPKQSVRVEIHRCVVGGGEDPKVFALLESDNRGEVLTKVLPPGKYHVIASGEGNLRADMYLDVSTKSENQVSLFSMNLSESPYLTSDQLWAAADRLPVSDRVVTFDGTIYDPSGAAKVVGVSIEVAKKGTRGKEKIVHLKSDENGRFSERLPPGEYVASFAASGFRTSFVPFEVTRNGSPDLRIVLQLAPSAEAVRVANDQRRKTND